MNSRPATVHNHHSHQNHHNHSRTPHGSMLLPWSSASKILLVTLFTLTLYTVLVNGAGYLGPRYGKRLPLPMQGGEVSRIVGRSSGPRTIQSRSQARFYAGSRYGGKRSYWPPSLIPSDMDSLDSAAAANYASSPPYDCIYIPYVGVRCGVLRSSSDLLSQNGPPSDHDPAEDVGEMSPPFSGGSSASLTRTSIIDTVPSGSGSGSDN